MADDLALGRLVALAAADLDARGYSYAGIVRQAAQRLLEVAEPPDPEPAADRCRRCNAPITQPARGRPRLYCSDPCRKGRTKPDVMVR